MGTIVGHLLGYARILLAHQRWRGCHCPTLCSLSLKQRYLLHCHRRVARLLAACAVVDVDESARMGKVVSIDDDIEMVESMGENTLKTMLI